MNHPPIKSPNTTTVKGECSNCGTKEQWLFHRVLVRGVDRRVCTSCVLRLHPSSFCPFCFEFFENPLSVTSSASAHRFISCIKCSSLSHIHCLPSPPPSSFLCPPCSKPNFSFFPIQNSMLDKNLAVVLLCASKIAAATMAKTLAIYRTRADRAVREAAAARKKAKEALDHCFVLEKVKRLEGAIDVSGSRNLELCKKEDFNGGRIKGPSEVSVSVSNQNGLSVVVNINGANGIGNPVNTKPANDGKQDLDRVRSTVVDFTSTTCTL